MIILITDLVRSLHRKLISKYGLSKLKRADLEAIFQLKEPKGKTILDLGCGSISSPDSTDLSRGMYEPWLLRALHEYGSHCIGADLGDLTREPFEGYSLDLSKPDSLKVLKPGSVDIACAFSFFDSPALAQESEGAFKTLLPQLERIVKKDGYFIFETLGTPHYI